MENIELPLSKSILNRCLILSAISKEKLNHLPANNHLPNDVIVMKRLLFENETSNYDVEDAGTVFRFLTAYLSNIKGSHLLYGTPKLNSRPITPLIEALKSLGAEIYSTTIPNEAPLKIEGRQLIGGEITLDASASSQFVSALMLIAPTFRDGLTINLKNATSFPYISITNECLGYFGVKTEITKTQVRVFTTPKFVINEDALMHIETDWSSAAFWYALSAVAGKSFSFKNLSLNSIQGDKLAAQLFTKLGIITHENEDGIYIECKPITNSILEFDLQDCPDLAPALIVACGIKKIEAKFYGLHTLQFKESNRVLALQQELNKLHINFTEINEYWQLISNYDARINATLNTHDDHRLAMAFACVKALNPEIEIMNPACVKKSNPMFWTDFYRVFPNDSKQIL